MPEAQLAGETVQILNDLNPWWVTGVMRVPAPSYRRRGVESVIRRLSRRAGLIEVLRGPRQVGKTTAIGQTIEHLLSSGVRPADILFVRFDQEVLRETRGGLIPIVRWFRDAVRRREFEVGAPAYVFLDEVHKLPRWDEDVKHLGDTFPLRLTLTGSSSVMVARGGRESLAGRVITTEMPTFQFREVLEGWFPIARKLPPPRVFEDLMGRPDLFEPYRSLKAQQRLALQRHLERYYNRGGYPRLYTNEVDADLWADYLTETVFERVLGVDVPDLVPVRNPQLLRWLFVEVARSTGQELSQNRLAEDAQVAGFQASQPNIGTYLHYLDDALLIREFRRYPLARRAAARTPSKFTLTDLGVRNAIFRGAPSLFESPSDVTGPLIETLAQSVIRGPGLHVHFFRDYERAGDRRSATREVDFVVVNLAGEALPIEVKFRKNLHTEDFAGLRLFMARHKARHAVMITRDLYDWRESEGILCVPLLDFLLAF